MKNKVGDRIHKRRVELGLSAAELAQRVGVTRAFVYMLEKGSSGVTDERLCEFARVLGVAITDLNPEAIQAEVKDPEYLNYLAKTHTLDADDRREIRKMVERFGIPNRFPDEKTGEFEKRWEAFYCQILQYLPNASLKILSHPDVKSACSAMGLRGEIRSWRQLYVSFQQRLEKCIRLNDGQMVNGKQWKSCVAKALGINETDGTRNDGWDGLTAAQIGAIAAQIKSSPRFYSAIVKETGVNRYWYVKCEERKLFDRRDASWWHEAARVLLDPELKLKSGAIYYPDGEECPPIEQLFRRVASWFAVYPFVGRFKEDVRQITPRGIEHFIKTKFGDDLPWRTGFIGLLDSIDKPLAYVDIYKRMKRNELKSAGLDMIDVVKVASHKDARLRIAFLARNFSAEESNLELRTSLKIPRASSLYHVYATRSQQEQELKEDFSLWDPRYDLHGKAMVCGYYQKGRGEVEHVRALIRGLTER